MAAKCKKKKKRKKFAVKRLLIADEWSREEGAALNSSSGFLSASRISCPLGV